MKKRLLAILLTGLLCFFSLGCFALTDHSISVTYNGVPLLFPDAQPLIENGRTLVPVRVLLEKTGLSVTFVPDTRTVIAEKEGFSISFVIDSPLVTYLYGNRAETVSTDVPPRLIEDRVYVPLRFLSERLRHIVFWDAERREVNVVDSDQWENMIRGSSQELYNLLYNTFSYDAPQSGDTIASFDMAFVDPALPNSAVGTDVSYFATLVYDGQSAGITGSLETDLTAIAPLLSQYLEPTLLGKLAKYHRIDFDCVKDSDGNIYLKSEGIKSLLRSLGKEALADAWGEQYLLFTPEDYCRPGRMKISLANLLLNFLEDTDFLSSKQIARIDGLISLCADLFRDEYYETAALEGGTLQTNFTLDPEVFYRAWTETADQITAAEELTMMPVLAAGIVIFDRPFNPGRDKLIVLPGYTVSWSEIKNK